MERGTGSKTCCPSPHPSNCDGACRPAEPSFCLSADGRIIPVDRVTRKPIRPQILIVEPKPPVGLGRDEILARVVVLKDQAKALRSVQRRDPGAFLEDKSELIQAIERFEDDLRGRPGVR